ncbi:MAG: D-tyrosyl-tRNA(Tyr) deacylase [Acidiferrobacterales bacterium]|nr:D-tyrosyl-tRNA(Tyr) deacylase [Acidiferrobacterales bacterium]
MRILLQRVASARVDIAKQTVGEIQQGLLLLAGFGKLDQTLFEDNALEPVLEKASNKLVNMRVFSNQKGKLDFSVLEKEGDILLIPQFTLFGKSEKGRRPDFTDAMHPEVAKLAFERFHQCLEVKLGKPVPTGVFGADMVVSLVNDGPFTLQLTF